MSAADGLHVVRIVDRAGQPVRRAWRVAVQIPGPPCVLGTAVLVAETASEACARIRRAYAGACVLHVESAGGDGSHS